VRYLSGRVPADKIVTNGAGNYSAWLQRYFQYKVFVRSCADQRINGLWRARCGRGEAGAPDRMVIAFAGDRCSLINAGACDRRAVSVECHLRGGKKRHLRDRPRASGARISGRVFETDRANPDPALFAQQFGCHVEVLKAQRNPRRLGTTHILRRTCADRDPQDPDALAPRLSLTEIRANALANMKG
jgi:acetolactate synthase-1/2/3 large subunit